MTAKTCRRRLATAQTVARLGTRIKRTPRVSSISIRRVGTLQFIKEASRT